MDQQALRFCIRQMSLKQQSKFPQTADQHAVSVSRREFFAGTAAALAGSLATSCQFAAGPRPNILWIIGEDFSPDLGCYGNRIVHTPNLDRLASQGLRYTNAFVTGPVCSASRSALATGMYQTSIGAQNHRSHRDDGYKLPAGVRLFTEYLREAGYHTSNLKGGELEGTGKTDFNFNVEKPFDGTDWSERKPGQLFYAQINFTETHRAFKRFPDRPIDPGTVELPPYYPDHPAVRLDWELYLETAQHLDRKVGRVLERLESEGLADDTVVFFFGDHGRPMPRGKQFLYEGGVLIPLLVRVPQKYRPEGFAPGGTDDNLISAIDITATTLSLAGVKLPDNMEGRPFLGREVRPRDYVICARDRCDETVDRIRAVRTKQYKYIRNFYPDRPYTQQNIYKDTNYPPLQVMRQLQTQGKLTVAQALFMARKRPEEELFDLEADPYEISNLAGLPEQKATLDQLRGVLNDWIQQAKDQGAIPEKELPDEFKYRTQVEGWSTSNGLLSREGNGLKLRWVGQAGRVILPTVMEGDNLTLRFRARSADLAPQKFFWGTIDNVRGQGNEIELEFQADGNWHGLAVDFQPEGFLANFGFEFGATKGEIEFDWFRLYRNRGRNLQMLQQWEFADS
jgi:N-sulfoglucosamine sulfohydrolase